MNTETVDDLMARRAARGPIVNRYEAPPDVLSPAPEPPAPILSINANGKLLARINETGQAQLEPGVDGQQFIAALYATIRNQAEAMAKKQQAFCHQDLTDDGVRNVVNILQDHCGEKGDNEGATETLQRIVRERDAYLAELVRTGTPVAPTGHYYIDLAKLVAGDMEYLTKALIERDIAIIALKQISRGKGGVAIAKRMLSRFDRKVSDIPISSNKVLK